MSKTSNFLRIAALAALACQCQAEALFGHGKLPGSPAVEKYKDFGKQAHFFASNDYGFAPGGEDQLTGAKLGIKWKPGGLYTRGQDPVSCNYPYQSFQWLGDGGKGVFGLTLDHPVKPLFEASPERQFARCPGKEPRFDQAVVHWGGLVPKPGSWGACVLDTDGNFKQIAVDSAKTIYPYDQTTIDFPPTAVKTIYFGLREPHDNFAEVRFISLNMHNPKLLDNHLVIWRLDAYLAEYSAEQPGALVGLQVANMYFATPNASKRDGTNDILSGLAPFVELAGERFHASKADYPVETAKDGGADILRYQLRFDLPGGKQATVDVKATFGVSLDGTMVFAHRAKGLPERARLGFEMSGPTALFCEYADRAAPVVENLDGRKTFATPAGPVGLETDGAAKLVTTRLDRKNLIRFDILAEGAELAVSLSLPIGPLAGVQPGMVNYNWRPALADQGDEGIAPFKQEDLELMETVDLSNPNDPHEVYDVSNDPLVAAWRKTGDKKLPPEFGLLNLANQPEQGKVPLTTVLGQKCRAINNNDTCYFRFNLKCRFNAMAPYLVVVEHAFDKERRGAFHTVGLEPDGTKIVAHNLWGLPRPFGGFDTGAAPYEGRFKKESVFYFYPDAKNYSPTTMVSFCFSNSLQRNYDILKSGRELPDGLAIKSVSVYRVKNMPRTPDAAALIPKGAKRHVTIHVENASPWMLSELPKLAGYNSLWANHQNPGQFLCGKEARVNRPSLQADWHAGTLESNRWLYEKADKEGVAVKAHLGWLVDLGFEGTDHDSFLGDGWFAGDWDSMSLPLSPTPEELAHVGGALDRALDALAKYQSFTDIGVEGSARGFYTKRNFDDFSRETGVPFASSPSLYENANRLIDSPKATIDAWIKWSCQKRFESLSWLLNLARKHRPDLYLTVGQSWYVNNFQHDYFSDRAVFAPAKLKAKGFDDYLGFLKLACHDPGLYREGDGFCFAIEEERGDWVPSYHWPSPYKAKWFPALRDGFGGGLCALSSLYDEGPKPLARWTCQYFRDQRSFRRNLLDALLQANARDFVLGTYTLEPYRGRLNDLRTIAVPFQLLPFAKPEAFAGKISDSAKQAVIHKYGDRHGLVNYGDKPTDVTLTLPEGAETVFDLSNGVRQELLSDAPIHMDPWSLKTFEIK